MSTADDVKKGFDSLSQGFSEASKRKVAELVNQQGYVEYGRPEAQEAFRKTYSGWNEEVLPDGKIRFKPPAANKPSPQRTAKSFAEEIASGKNLQSPEDIQFYQNNAKEIEKELTSMADDVKNYKDKNVIPESEKPITDPVEPKKPVSTPEPATASKSTPAPEPTPSATPKPEPAPRPSPAPEAGPTPKPAPAKPTTAPASKAAKSALSKGALVKGGIVGAVAAGLYFLLKPSSSNRQPNGILTNNSVNDISNIELQNNFTVSKFATGNASIRRFNGSGSIYRPNKRNHGSRSMGGY